ncbi:RNA polymerase II Mediator complex subunit Sin4 like protein [Zymoseptoria brevis]|uniref:Mediator of RNA polymerase II transcription subunit 16 n=1 Tax=Zymoseptoria brevis TaxID=1047168 RepID=A0A0F4GH51_9PEZI|nr:RNA polymerase II Mediator complex subunit Sin4 like protein [Zymoseptoria brevis]
MDTNQIEEASMVDAAMMDPTMEDLFGEAANDLAVGDLGVGLPPIPLPPSLMLRIAELQHTGCCTKLAWSNTGSIARISEDGTQVTFHVMRRHRKTGQWCVGRPSRYPLKVPGGREFVHIQFSGIGIDLAVVDDLGIVHMHTLTGGLGRMVPAEGNISNHVTRNELHAVVGMHWLAVWTTEFTGPYIRPANKIGNKWEAQLQQRDQHSIKIHHPAMGRHAMLYITRSTELTLLYQNEGQGWQSTSIVIDEVRSSDQIISHAAMGEEGADLLVVTFDHSSRMRLYRVSIEWNATQHSLQAGMVYTLIAPTMEVHHLTASHHTRAQHAHSAQLTHLKIIPAVPEAAQTMPTATTILAVFTQTSVPSDANPPQNAYSIVSRWRVESLMPTLHDSFKKLSNARADSNGILNPTTVLRREPDIITNKAILAISSQMFDTMLAFTSSDGSIDLRDRLTMDQLGPFGSPTTVASLPQAGFDHLASTQNLHVALSANASGLAAISASDNSLTARPMTFTHGWTPSTPSALLDNTPYLEAGIVCLARQYAFLCYNSMSNDEVLSLLPYPAPNPSLHTTFLTQVFKMVNRSPDISMHESARQQMAVLKEPIVPRVLSAQLSLGTDPITGKRDVAAQYAYIFLNLRHIGTALAHTISQKDLSRVSPEAVHSLRPLVRWSIDLMIHIISTLSTLRQDPSTISTSSSPILPLLLASFSRALLRFQVLWVIKYLHLLQQIIPRLPTLAQRAELSATLELGTKSLPFKLPALEALLVDVDSAIRQVYSSGEVNAERRGEIEVGLICGGGEVPRELRAVVARLIDVGVGKVLDAEGTDVVKLRFWDMTWLGIERVQAPPPRSLHTNGTNTRKSPPTEAVFPGDMEIAGRWGYDVIRKVPLTEGMVVRECRRCGAVMEDFSPDRVRASPGWLGHAQKNCVCMNYWVCG